MNFKKLSSVLARRKMLVLYFNKEGPQWAGDDFSCYELSGLPTWMTVDKQIGTIGSDGGSVTFRMSTGVPEYSGEVLDASGCYVLPERYLQPIYSDQMQLFLRTMPETGEGKIIAKEGMFVTALFAPISASEDLQAWMVKTCNAMN